MNETLSLGQLVAAQIVVSLVVASFSKLGKQLESYYDLLAATDKLGYLFDLPLERGGGAANPAKGGGMKLVAKDVTFTYDGGHHPALEHFSLTLQPGERLALVGPSGSGKSTFVDLVFGTRTPDHGRIEIDGYDLRELDLPTAREQIAVVKGIEAFTGTILANLRMGREYLSIAEVREALERVDLLETVLDLPDGLNSMLAPSGAPLSQGQANRLMLARAIAGEPRLLVLDEVLDNMDESVRSKVYPAVFGPEAKWTLLVVTHSAEIVKQCTRNVRFRRRGYNESSHPETGHGHDGEQHLPAHH
jgi:putative ABC transport system ATP-binding protein